MNRKLITRYIALFYAIGILAGVVLILAGTRLSNQEWSNGLLALGVAVSSTVAVTGLFRWLGPEALQQVTNTAVWGAEIRLQADADLFQKIRGARRLDFFFNTGRALIITYLDDIEEALRRSCQIRILLSSPQNACVTDTHARESLSRGVDLDGEITSVTKRLSAAAKKLRAEGHHSGSLEIRYNLAIPSCAMTIIDDAVARVTPYLPFQGSSPTSPCIDVTQSRELLKVYADTFEALWSYNKDNLFLRVNFRQQAENDIVPQD
jgi:hypothetical protein